MYSVYTTYAEAGALSERGRDLSRAQAGRLAVKLRQEGNAAGKAVKVVVYAYGVLRYSDIGRIITAGN